MATLNPVAMLILYIALAAAPTTAKQVIVQFTLNQRMIFTRTAEGWWLKPDDLGNPVYWKNDKAKLMVRGGSSSNVEELKLLNFGLTGEEDWSKPKTVFSKAADKTKIRTKPGKKGILLTVLLPKEKAQEYSIDWSVPESQ